MACRSKESKSKPKLNEATRSGGDKGIRLQSVPLNLLPLRRRGLSEMKWTWQVLDRTRELTFRCGAIIEDGISQLVLFLS